MVTTIMNWWGPNVIHFGIESQFGPDQFILVVTISFWSWPNHYGQVQINLARKKPFWTDQNCFGHIEGQGIKVKNLALPIGLQDFVIRGKLRMDWISSPLVFKLGGFSDVFSSLLSLVFIVFSGPPWLARPPRPRPCLDFGIQCALIRNNWSKNWVEY